MQLWDSLGIHAPGSWFTVQRSACQIAIRRHGADHGGLTAPVPAGSVRKRGLSVPRFVATGSSVG